MLPSKAKPLEFSRYIEDRYQSHPRIQDPQSSKPSPFNRSELEDLMAVSARSRVGDNRVMGMVNRLLEAEGYGFDQQVRNRESFDSTVISDFDESLNERLAALATQPYLVKPSDLDLCFRIVYNFQHLNKNQFTVLRNARTILGYFGLTKRYSRYDEMLREIHGMPIENELNRRNQISKGGIRWNFTTERLLMSSSFFTVSTLASRSLDELAKHRIKNLNFNSTEEFLDHIDGKTVLDLGSGIGIFAKIAKKYKSNAQFYNINPGLVSDRYKEAVLERTRKAIGTKDGIFFDEFKAIDDNSITAFWHDIAESEVPNESVDLLVSDDAFPRYCDTRGEAKAVLEQIKRVLKPGGEARLSPVFIYDDNLDFGAPSYLHVIEALAQELGFNTEAVPLNNTDLNGNQEHCLILEKPKHD